MKVVSVNVGTVAQHTNARGRLAKTGLYKTPTTHPIQVGKLGIKGDASAYRSRRLGDTAIHLFTQEAYAYLNRSLAIELPIPCFGENLTVSGYPDADIRIGDVLQIGSVVLMVNQPVVRCSWPTTLGGDKRLTKQATKAGLTGCYLQVKQPGELVAGDTVQLVERGHREHNLIQLNSLFYGKDQGAMLANGALASPALADRWKREYRAKVA